ncbi:late lactation protein B-like [Phascolarctos cinereus]|uniref:Late lactation protein B-like n=1 Tax=Phascolarctos cinereus TaxID=38626 RepID=A0A6P5JX91_PHACI|nr:late lactation protein B-like [Phascolarctos cinereus]
MKVLFLTIALSLFSILQAEESASSGEALGGTFYIHAIVADTDIPEEKRPKSLSPITISLLDDGNVEASFTTRKNGKCKEIKAKLEKTDNPYEFTMDKGKRHVYVTKTSDPNSWILYSEGEFRGKQVKLAKLLGASTEVDSEVLKEYQEFIQQKGFNEKRIISPKQEEACIPEDA